jgi:hypothetical protein
VLKYCWQLWHDIVKLPRKKRNPETIQDRNTMASSAHGGEVRQISVLEEGDITSLGVEYGGGRREWV